VNFKFQHMNSRTSLSSKCKRCHQPTSGDIICQECKSVLLNHFEATADWQAAFEIEKAQQSAERYQREYSAESDLFYFY